jgi:hypothetical protein
MKVDEGTGGSDLNMGREPDNLSLHVRQESNNPRFGAKLKGPMDRDAGNREKTAIDPEIKTNQNPATVNPNFKKEFGDYLEANGYALSSQPAQPGDALYFFRNGQGVMITGDSIDFASFSEQGPGKSSSCSTYAAFTGISRLDTYGWMMLMHITGIVPLNQFMLGGSSKPLRTWPGWAAAAVC